MRRRASPLALLLVLGAGCATALGARTEGHSGPIAWEVTDLELATRNVDGVDRQLYSFTLVLRETGGRTVQVTRMDTTMYQPGVGSSTSAHTTPWVLPALGERRVPFSSYVYCPAAHAGCELPASHVPLWHIVLTGADPGGAAVKAVIELALPADPRRRPPTVARAPRPSWPTPVSAVGAAVGTSVVPVELQQGVVLVPVKLNRMQGALLLLDTGASVTLLTPALAEKLDAMPKPGAPTRKLTVVGGQKIDVPFVRLAAVQVGDFLVEDLDVGVYAILPDAPLVDGLLGADILERFTMTLDRGARRLRLEPRK